MGNLSGDSSDIRYELFEYKIIHELVKIYPLISNDPF